MEPGSLALAVAIVRELAWRFVAAQRAPMRRARVGRRLSAALAGYLVLVLLIGGRLVSVQVVDAAEYRGLAERQAQREITLTAPRGKLYDRSGQPLAVSLTAATIYANPRQIASSGVRPEDVAAELAPLVDVDAATLAEDLRRDSGFVYVARQRDRKVGEEIRARQQAKDAKDPLLAAHLPGVGVLAEPRREYPADGLAAQVVGFAGVDNVGLSGLEQAHDDALTGQPGLLRQEGAPGGVTISTVTPEVQPAVPGTDLVLTLDRQIQYVTEEALARAVEQFDAKGASAVVLDIATGDVLAMASAPGYTSATIGTADAYARRNRVITDVVEPGSVNKVITLAGALEEGAISTRDTFTVADHYYVGSRRFKDSHPHPTEEMTPEQILVTSSNVGTIQIAERLGPEKLHEYLQRFGYGRQTGIDFPGESAGLLHPPEDWSATSLPTISIGQGVSATLLQVANVYAAIAADGVLTEPRLLRGTVGPDGQLQHAPRGEEHTAVSAKTARTMRRMLADVVESDEGTGHLARVAGYTVAGKTGTAQKPSETRRGYEPGAYIGSFAGYAPADDPQLVVAVMVDEPTPIYGGLTAAPVFSEIMGFALAHRRVVPTDPQEREPGAVVAETVAHPAGDDD